MTSTTQISNYAAFTFCQKLTNFPDEVTTGAIIDPSKDITCQADFDFGIYALISQAPQA